MKKIFNVIYIFVLVLLVVGCNTEMRIERLNVEQNKDIIYSRLTAVNPSEYFYVESVDTNGSKSEIICVGILDVNGNPFAGEFDKDANGKKILYTSTCCYLQTVSGNYYQAGEWKVKVVYVPGGNYYNYSNRVYSEDIYTINVIEPTIEKISLQVADSSVFVQGLTWQLNTELGYLGGGIKATYTYGDLTADGSIALVKDGVMAEGVKIIGVSNKSIPGEYKVKATYAGLTTDEVSVWVVPKVIGTYNIKYYDNTTDLNLEPKNYTNLDATIDLPTHTKTGFSFDGWCKIKDASGDGTGDIITAISNGTLGDFDFYAKWTKQP